MSSPPVSNILPADYTEGADKVNSAYREISRNNFLVFVRGLIIPSASGPRLFDLVMADFQREFFGDIAPSLHAIKDGRMPPARRFWLERTKKTSKDADVAACLLWLMAFSTRPILGQVCAANSEQAAIIEDRSTSLLHYNPWLREYVEIIQRMIRSKTMPRETKVQIEATGSAGSAQGPTPDILVLNELVHVDRWEVMRSHMNNAAGVPRGVVIVATNAGIKGTPAEVWRNNALNNRKRWNVHLWSKRAPWISKEDMEDARRLDPIGAEFARLWEGKWVSGIGDAVDQDSIDRCFCSPGPLSAPEQNWRYIAGLDLGISHDHAGIVGLGVSEREQRVKETWMRGYAPSVPNDKGVLEVDCDQVEEDAYNLWKTFHIEHFGYDPAAGGSFMAQRLRKRGVPMREMTFSSSTNQTEMAVAFVTLMKDGKLECYEDSEGRMRRDFGKFNIEHKPPSRYKLVAVSDEHGHADVGVSLVIALPKAVEMLGGSIRLQKEDVLVDANDEELSGKEVEGMPEALREIYDMGVEDDEEWRVKKCPKISDLD